MTTEFKYKKIMSLKKVVLIAGLLHQIALYCLLFPFFVSTHGITQTYQCSRRSMEKAASTVVFMNANQSGQTEGLLYLHVSPRGEASVWFCGWKVGHPGWNTYLLQAYFLDCEPCHMGQACSVCRQPAMLDLSDCSILAPLHTGIPWKHRHILKHSGKLPRHCGYIVKLVLFFPSFMGKAKIVPRCW